jgi:hypothetical protein
VSDPLWDRLLGDGYIDAVLTGGSEEFRDMVEAAKEWLQFSREHARWEREQQKLGKPRPIAPDPGEYVRQRALARDDALAFKASRTTMVRAFRDQFTGGALLSVPLARQLLASEAARRWSGRDFERLGIPIMGHRAVVVAERWLVEESVPWRGPIDTQTVDLKVTWDDQVREAPASRSGVILRDRDVPVLHVIDEHGKPHEKEVWPRSVLGRLRETSHMLAQAYEFNAAQAAWFILTDTPPRRAPLEGNVAVEVRRTHNDGRVTLSMEPWVPADVVLQSYRDIQRDLLGRENRPLSLRNLAVLRSVLEDAREAARTNPGAPPPSRAQSMARWNREHPEETYAQEWQFNRDVDRAERGVLFPLYRIGNADTEERG